MARQHYAGGTLESYIRKLFITGLTSNPSIFDRAIRDTGFYDDAIRGKLQEQGAAGFVKSWQDLMSCIQ